MCRLIVGLVLFCTLIVSPLAGIVPVSAQETTYTDTMDSAATGLLSTVSPDPTVSYSYENGQFMVRQTDPAHTGELVSYLGVPAMASSRVTVDAAIAGSVDGKYVLVGCRDGGDGTGYMLGVSPGSGQIILFRLDPDDSVVLAQQTSPELVHPGNAVNRIGIDCRTNVITGSINGQPVLSTVDTTYTQGESSIGAGASGRQNDGLSVSFDNLEVTDYGTIALGPETPVVTAIPPVVPTAQPVPTETASPSEDLPMEPITEPWVDPEDAFFDAFDFSIEFDPVASEIEGTTELQPGEYQMLPADVALADFYAELYYLLPEIPEGGEFSVGFCFWVDADNNCFNVYLQIDPAGNATIGSGFSPAAGDYQAWVMTNTLAEIPVDATPGSENVLGLVIYDGYAILTGNDYDVLALIALPDTAVAGKVKAEIGFVDWGLPAATPPLAVTITELSVWDLSSGMIPVIDWLDDTTPAAEPTASASEPSPTSVTKPFGK